MLRGGRQPSEIETGPANEGAAVGAGGKFQAFGRRFGENKTVDGVGHFGTASGGWRFEFRQRLERPPLLVLIGHHRLVAPRTLVSDERAVVGRAVIDPGGNLRDCRLWQSRFFVRHVGFFFMPDELEEPTGSGVKRYQHHADGSALQQVLAGRQNKTAFGLFPAVASEALVDEQRSDVFLKRLESPRHAAGMIGRKIACSLDAPKGRDCEPKSNNGRPKRCQAPGKEAEGFARVTGHFNSTVSGSL